MDEAPSFPYTTNIDIKYEPLTLIDVPGLVAACTAREVLLHECNQLTDRRTGHAWYGTWQRCTARDVRHTSGSCAPVSCD